MEWIIFLLVVGMILVIVEVFLPSGLFGLAGGGCIAAGVAMTYSGYGATAGTWLLGGVILATFIGLILWIKYFPRTPTGRRMMLDSVGANVTPEAAYGKFIGKRGVARSNLRPAGIAEFDGCRLDVMSEGGIIAPGSEVQVVAVDGTKIVVRKI